MTDDVGPARRANGARAVPAGYDALGCGRKADAPWVTWVQSFTPNVRTQPTPAVTQTRGVEDAAPYGRLRNVGISIAVNSCAKATASAHASAPLKGELSRRDAP